MAQEHFIFNQKCIRVCVALMYLLQIYQINGMVDETLNFSNRILGGEEALREQWPFKAALFKVKDSSYFCGGTIITNRHILTTASCIQSKGSSRKLSPNDVAVRLGAYNLTIENEEGAVMIHVTEIIVHPDWNVYDEAYDSDIAILVLNETIHFTNYIQPVSLPADNLIIDGGTINVTGTIVGWGLAERKTPEEIPRQVEIQTMNNTYCYLSDVGIITLSSRLTFCGKGNGEGTPNRGDSGGGFFVDSGSEWVQYGIISASRTNDAGQIVKSSYSVYGNVKAFKNWITEKTGGETKIDDQTKVNPNCVYRYYRGKYVCIVMSLDNQTENSEVATFTGNHIRRKTEQDVRMIKFRNGTAFYLPNGIGKLFKNLKTLEAEGGLNNAFIGRSNLQNLQNLIELNFNNNEIEVVDADALWDLPALQVFLLMHNKVKELHESTFDRNLNLRIVFLQSNELELIPRNMFKNNNLLEKVDLSKNSLKIIQVDFTSLNNVLYINLNDNVCIDASYGGPPHRRRKLRNLMRTFQNEIRSKCSSTFI